MKISTIGEFGLINRIARKPNDKSIIVGIGDDAAVVKIGKKYVVCTTDTLIEGDHFSLEYYSPEQVGMKAIEVNVSDIGSMGAVPKYALISLALRKGMDVAFVERLYKGMRSAAGKYGIEIIGGNTAHANQIVIHVDLIGFLEIKKLKLRSMAKPGDFILVSGDLGGSAAGLNLLKNNIPGHAKTKKRHLEPKAKFHKVRPFLRYINAMQDISDGLASEITHVCSQSKVGALLFADNVPIKEETRQAAHAIRKDALQYALYGGEDFELVYTVSEKNLNKVRGYLIGEITSKKDIMMYRNGKNIPLRKRGYDHFA